jgi:cysteinyl-tRNA synthetase
LIDRDILAVQERTGRQLFARQEPAVEIEPDAKIGKLTGEFFYSVVGFSAERELSRKKLTSWARVRTWELTQGRSRPGFCPWKTSEPANRRGKALGRRRPGWHIECFLP